MIGVRLDPELELQLEQVARSQGRSRSACLRDAIRLYLHHFCNGEDAQRQSALIARHEAEAHWSEQVPDWDDWTA
jgi:predicted transcriptional regulator